MPDTQLDLKSFIRDIPDFPKKDIIFKDITPLLRDRGAFRQAVEQIAEPFLTAGISSVVCVEARGFIFGSAVSSFLNAGLVLVRKKDKLPYKTFDVTYDLEYGQDTLSIHQDALADGETILVVDDLLATGGTVGAVTKLLEAFRVRIAGIACLVELSFLNPRQRLSEHNIHSVIRY